MIAHLTHFTFIINVDFKGVCICVYFHQKGRRNVKKIKSELLKSGFSLKSSDCVKTSENVSALKYERKGEPGEEEGGGDEKVKWR